MTDENTSASDLCACDSSHAGQGWLPGRDGLTTGCKQERLRPRVPDLGRSRRDSPAWCLCLGVAPWVTCLSTRIESARSPSACARVLWTGAFVDSPLQHGQFCHLRIASWVTYWGPRRFPVPSAKKAAQSQSWQHPPPTKPSLPLPLDVASSRTGDTGSEVGCFCFVLLE